MLHFTYQTTNKVNGKYYIGVHSTSDINDGYLGSGKYLKLAIKKYGKESFVRTELCFFDDADSAYEEEEFLLDGLWSLNENYNGTSGGRGGHNGSKGWKHSDSSKRIFSESKKGSRNPKHKGTIVTPLGEFNSTREAAKAHGLSASTIKSRLNNGTYQYPKNKKRYWSKSVWNEYYYKK